ncbi:MAG: hypothetical protein JXR10_06120 [Cyclobacteriaceae bacterium]
MKKLLMIFTFLLAFETYAQDNLQVYTPSILFDKGEWEYKSFQNLYTQKRSFDLDGGFGKTAAAAESQVFFTSINQFLYGVNSQINVGLDVWVNYTALPFAGSRESQTGVSLIGPKVKIAPFKSLQRLSIQSSYLFKAADDLENRLPNAENPFFFFANDRSIWLTQFFYDLPINDQLQLFFQQAIWYSVVDDSFRDNNYLQTQTSVFASYFPNSRWTLYGMMEYFPTHYNDLKQSSQGFYSYFVQSGIGTKFQAIPNKLELEFLYTNFIVGSAGGGAGQTINFGIRLIRQ